MHESAAAGRSKAVSLLSGLSQLILLACLLVSPWIFGGVQFNVQVVLCGAVLAAGGVCCASVLLNSSRVPKRQLLPFVPFLMIVAVALLHLLPTPWQSYYPAATRLEVARLVMAAGVFGIATVLFQSTASRPMLWAMIAANGAVLAFFGVAHKLRPDAGLFSYVPTHGGSPFASFVSKNSAAGYLNLCVAAGLGLLMWSRARSARRLGKIAKMQNPANDVSPDHKHKGKRSPHSRFHARPRLDAIQIFAIALIVTCLAGIFSSMARGASIAALSAGAITALSVPRRSRVMMILLCTTVGLLCFALISWSGLIPQVESRLSTLGGDELTENGRWAHWSDALRAVSHSWLTGTGLGTYRYAYLPYQANTWTVWFHHAENQYLETLLECGIVGLAALLSLMTLIASQLYKLFKRGEHSGSADIRVAGLFAFCSMGIQSLFDFPLVIPSNMLLFAVICGAITGSVMALSAASPAKPTHRPQPHLDKYRLVPTWATALCFAYGAFGFHELQVAADIQVARDDAPSPADLHPDPTNLVQQLSDLDRHIDELTTLAARKADDAELQQQIAELWISRYRLQTFQQNIATQTDTVNESQNRSSLWKATNPVLLYANANTAQQTGHPELVDELRHNSLVTQNLVPAVRHLQLAEQSCSILPRVNLDLATLAFVFDKSPDGAEFLQRELHLSSANSDTLSTVGVCAFSTGLKDLANSAWSRSLTLHPTQLNDIVDFLVAEKVGIDDIVLALPDSPHMLAELAATRFSGAEHATDRIALLGRARKLLDAESPESRDEQWHRQFARVHIAARNTDAAVAEYRRAIQLAPLQLETRLELSRVLQQQERYTEAYEEARVCAALEPDRDDIKTLIRQLLRKEQSMLEKGVRNQ